MKVVKGNQQATWQMILSRKYTIKRRVGHKSEAREVLRAYFSKAISFSLLKKTFMHSKCFVSPFIQFNVVLNKNLDYSSHHPLA